MWRRALGSRSIRPEAALAVLVSLLGLAGPSAAQGLEVEEPVGSPEAGPGESADAEPPKPTGAPGDEPEAGEPAPAGVSEAAPAQAPRSAAPERAATEASHPDTRRTPSETTPPQGPPPVPGAPPRATAPSAAGEASAARGPSSQSIPPAVPGTPPAWGSGRGWFDDLEIDALVDAYFALNTHFPKPQEGTNRLRAFDDNNGFSLSWAGLGARYASGPVAGTAELRFGPSADDLAGDDANHGLAFVKQAYATLSPELPSGELWFDFGKFDAPFGLEVADSQQNYNYTRGFLYTLARPRFHTGLGAAYRPVAPLTFKVLAVNGWNNSVDDNAGKTFGVQAAYASDGVPGESLFEARLGYLVGPEQSDIGLVPCPEGLAFDAVANACTPTGQDGTEFPVDRGGSNTGALRHLVDLAVIARPMDALELALGGDYGVDERGTDTVTERTFTSVSWYGAMLVGSYRFDEVWRVALRGEYYADPDAFTCGTLCSDLGIDELDLVSVTATAEARPVKNLALMLDVRFDHAEIGLGPDARFPPETGPGIFPVLRTYEPDQLTVTLGAIAFTN